MRKSTSDRMNDYYAVVMGVFESILVLSVIYEERLRLLDIANGYRNGYRADAVRVGALRSSTEVTAAAAASAHHRRGRCERLSGPESVSVMGPTDPPGGI